MFTILLFSSFYVLRTYLKDNAIFQLEQLSSNYSEVVKERISYYENIPITNQFLINQNLKSRNYEQITEALLTKSTFMIYCELVVIDDDNAIKSFRSLHSEARNIITQKYTLNSFPTLSSGKIVEDCDDFIWIEEYHSSHKLLTLYYPLYLDGAFKGTLRFSFNARDLSNSLCNNAIFKDGFFFIADQNGVFLNNNKFAYNTINEYINNSEYTNTEQYFDRFSAGHFFVNHNNAKSIIQYFPISTFNWQLGIMCPIDTMYSDASYMYFIGILFMLCFFGFSYILINRQVTSSYKPITDLIKSIDGISEGRFDIPSPPKDSSHETNILYNAFSNMQLELNQYVDKITETAKYQQRIDTEITVAQRVQNQFLTHQPVNNEHIKISSVLKQSRKVGGDLYDYFILDNKLVFAIGDVSGKGMPAAIYMGSFLKLFHYVANTSESVEDIFNILNEQMCADENTDMYITLFMGVIDLETGILSYCNAGHPFPIFITESGDVLNINNEPDVPIGIVDGYEYNCYSMQLRDKDKFVLYTDGITDAEDKFANFYGKENLYACIEKNKQDNPDELINHILNEIQVHIIDTKQSDDLTLMAIQYFS
ncbi:MAG: SpoIIE family protein phosphatase [Marinifilaceae bacterium]